MCAVCVQCVCGVGGLAGDKASKDEAVGVKIFGIKDRVREGWYKNDCCYRIASLSSITTFTFTQRRRRPLSSILHGFTYGCTPECRSGRVYQ